MLNKNKNTSFNNTKTYNSFKNSIKSSNIASSKNEQNIELKSFLDLYNENVSEYFERFDDYTGFFSTQQLESVDFSNFEEHVFFDSAIEKTNYSFKKIFNDFPYDGTKNDLINYLNSLDGYTKHILQNVFLKNVGYLRFDGTYQINTIDRNGSLLNDYKKQIKTGLLNISNNFNFSFDFWVYPISDSNNNQIIFQKYNNNQGYTLFLKDFANSKCNICFLIKNEDKEKFCFVENSSDYLSLNEWNHINISFESSLKENKGSTGKIYINGIPVKTTNSDNDIIKFDNSFNTVKCTIGNGENVANNTFTYLAGSSNNLHFIGLLDELKVFSNEIRSREVIAKEKNENITAKETLRLYYRFNEPSGNFTNNTLILDYSGNKLHGMSSSSSVHISLMRGTYNNIPNPLKYEKLDNNPVLFPSDKNAIDVQDNIIAEAKRYDLNNPNSFWKLLPKNLFIEGSDFDNIDETYVSEDKIKSSTELFKTKSKANQKMVNLFVIWARFFDQFKLYIDSISKVIDINYETLNNNKKLDGILLPMALKMSGFDFREILPYPVLEKLNNKNLTHEEVISDISIRQIQNSLWQRFLINSRDYLMTKGTLSSINSVFNSFGLEASRFISIKEFNGQNKFNIDNNLYAKKVSHKEIDFGCGESLFENSSTTVSTNNPSATNRLLLQTSTISSLNISEEWSIECLYSFDSFKKEVYNNTQSLLRIDNNILGSNFSRPHINVIFKRLNNKNEYGDIKVYINDVNNNNNIDIIEINNVYFLNGNTHYVNLSREFIDNTIQANRYYKYKITISGISNTFYSKEFKTNYIETKRDITSKSGINQILSIGKYNTYEAPTDSNYLSNMSYETEFQGKISNLKIYNTCLSEEEVFLKCKAINTVATNTGLENVVLNMDIYKDLSSYTKNSDDTYTIDSFVENIQTNTIKLHQGEDIDNFKPFTVRKIEILSQNSEIDFPRSNNHIYINDFKSDKFKKQYNNLNVSNTPRISPDYLYSKDNRLSIDFSLVNFINQDILKIININKEFSEKISQISNTYEDSYKDLYNFRETYFSRLEKEINIPDIYQMYKYFDNILEELLYECIPSKVRYKGFNFVYESHALERNKYQYKSSNSLIPVFNEENTYSYYSDLRNTKNYRQPEDFRISVIDKRKM